MQASSSSTVSSAVSTTILSTTSDAPTLTNNGMNRRLSTSSTARLDGKDGGPQIGFDEGIIQGLCDVDVSNCGRDGVRARVGVGSANANRALSFYCQTG